jgi:DNA gyrase subunit B
VREFQAVMMLIQHRLAKRYPQAILEALLHEVEVDEACLSDRSFMEAFVKRLEEKLTAQSHGAIRYHFDLLEDSERHFWQPSGIMVSHGVEHPILINKELFLSTEYRRMAVLGARLNTLLKPGAFVKRGEKQQNVSSFPELVSWLMAEAKKGQTISRYKGLGEMNPEQLWETTMDCGTRRMMQVRVEDAVAADKLFTTLMGDEVEPRRAFIEANALAVVNLDI